MTVIKAACKIGFDYDLYLLSSGHQDAIKSHIQSTSEQACNKVLARNGTPQQSACLAHIKPWAPRHAHTHTHIHEDKRNKKKIKSDPGLVAHAERLRQKDDKFTANLTSAT